jgi:putative membrane protein
MKALLSLHLLGVVLWTGGLLNLTRILGYHARESPSVRPRYSWLEGRLDFLVTVPGALLTVGTGVAQAWLDGAAYLQAATWLHVKLALVAVVAILHVWVSRRHRALARGPAAAPMKRAPYAAIHGTLGLIVIAILFLAVYKPMR